MPPDPAASVAATCPAPECGEPLLLEAWLSLVPIPGRARLGSVHARCGLAWTRKYGRNRALHALKELAGAISARGEQLRADVDEDELILTVAFKTALGASTDRVVVTPGDDGVMRYWWLAPRPSIKPEPPQMIPAALASLPSQMAARVEDRLILGISLPAS